MGRTHDSFSDQKLLGIHKAGLTSQTQPSPVRITFSIALASYPFITNEYEASIMIRTSQTQPTPAQITFRIMHKVIRTGVCWVWVVRLALGKGCLDLRLFQVMRKPLGKSSEVS